MSTCTHDSISKVGGGWQCNVCSEFLGAATKIPIGSGVSVNAYGVIDRAVTDAVEYGYRRAHKHTDRPGEDLLCQAIADAVMSELCEVLRFEDVKD